MKLNDKQTAAAIIAVGMAFMGMAIRNGIVTFKDRDRTVAVKGLCEREVKNMPTMRRLSILTLRLSMITFLLMMKRAYN